MFPPCWPPRLETPPVHERLPPFEDPPAPAGPPPFEAPPVDSDPPVLDAPAAPDVPPPIPSATLLEPVTVPPQAVVAAVTETTSCIFSPAIRERILVIEPLPNPSTLSPIDG